MPSLFFFQLFFFFSSDTVAVLVLFSFPFHIRAISVVFILDFLQDSMDYRTAGRVTPRDNSEGHFLVCDLTFLLQMRNCEIFTPASWISIKASRK